MKCFEDGRDFPLLTRRERQVLEYIAVGMSAKEVARRVELAPRTVERHIENIRLKLNARNSAHMVACAFANGMLTIEAA
jgi:LuxR family transcriptional regulator of spore coat protein